MQTVSREVLARWQVRKTKKQKRAFEAFLLRALREAGYADARAEECGALLKSRNLIVGNPDTAKVIFTAHYDTWCRAARAELHHADEPSRLDLLSAFACARHVPLCNCARGAYLAAAAFRGCAFRCVHAHVRGGAVLHVRLDVAGKANKAHANDNTSGVVALLEAAACDAGGTAQRGGVRLVRQ